MTTMKRTEAAQIMLGRHSTQLLSSPLLIGSAYSPSYRNFTLLIAIRLVSFAHCRLFPFLPLFYRLLGSPSPVSLAMR